MKKFKLQGTHGRYIVGYYISIQIVPHIQLDYDGGNMLTGQRPVIVNDSDMMLIYTDEQGCIWTEKIDAGDQIEFL